MELLIVKIICSFCKKEIGDSNLCVSLNYTCPECGNYLHSCLNCRFYDESMHNKCREPESEWVSDKQKKNYCNFFEIKVTKFANSANNNSKEEIRKLAESIFKK